MTGTNKRQPPRHHADKASDISLATSMDQATLNTIRHAIPAADTLAALELLVYSDTKRLLNGCRVPALGGHWRPKQRFTGITYERVIRLSSDC